MTKRERANAPALRAWARLVVATGARSVLLLAATLLFWAAIPAVWGWIPTTVASDSMGPNIRTGDVVVAMPVAPEEVRPGQVLLVNDPDVAGRMRLHRLVGFSDDGMLTLRGDANPTDDPSPVAPDQVLGVGVIAVPYAGLPGLWIGQGDLLKVGALIVTAGLVAAIGRPGASGMPSGPRRRLAAKRRTRRRLVAGGIAASLVVLAIGLSPAGIAGPAFARAAFNATTSNPSNTYLAAPSYDCLHKVPADSPFFYYRFSDASGSVAADDSGNARNGQLQGAFGRIAGNCLANSGPALTLDTATALVSTPTSVNSPGDTTVEIWFRTTATTGGRLIGFGDSQSGTSTVFDRHIYMTNSGALIAGIDKGSPKTVTTPLSYNDGAWHQVVAVFPGATGTMKIYVDGQEKAFTNGVRSVTGTGWWRIGSDSLEGWPNRPTTDFFTGAVDNAAVYTTMLSPSQVAAHYASGRD